MCAFKFIKDETQPQTNLIAPKKFAHYADSSHSLDDEQREKEMKGEGRE